MFRKIRRRLCTELSCINFTVVGITAGAALLMGAVLSTGFSFYPLYICFPASRIASFFYVLLHLFSYAVLGATLGIAIGIKPPLVTGKRELTSKTIAVILLACTLILAYFWIPLVCKAGSFFLGVLLCLVIGALLITLFLLLRKISILATVLLFVFFAWTVYLMYTAFSLIFIF